MKKYIVLLSLVMTLIGTPALRADKEISGQQLREWAEEQARLLPEVVDGIKMMRPVIEDERATVSEIVDIPGTDKNQIFIAALVYAVDCLDRSEKPVDEISAVDYESKRFVVTRKEAFREGTKQACAFKAVNAFQCADDMLSFSTYDIEVTYRELLINRTRAIESLNPMKNDRHKELFEDFSFVNSRYIAKMVEFIKANPALEVTHWKEIRNQEVVKGMNPTEVKLAVGAPVTVRETSGKTKWMYSNNFVVIFKDGVVSTVID